MKYEIYRNDQLVDQCVAKYDELKRIKDKFLRVKTVFDLSERGLYNLNKYKAVAVDVLHDSEQLYKATVRLDEGGASAPITLTVVGTPVTRG